MENLGVEMTHTGWKSLKKEKKSKFSKNVLYHALKYLSQGSDYRLCRINGHSTIPEMSARSMWKNHKLTSFMFLKE
jgi:hypothetical protein